MESLDTNQGRKSTDISKLLNIPAITVRRCLSDLLELGLVKVEGQGPSTLWFKM